MLTIAKLAAGSEGYYLATVASGVEDYYVGTGEAPGYWAGAAGFHGLDGEVTAEHLRASCWVGLYLAEALCRGCGLAEGAGVRRDGERAQERVAAVRAG